MFLDVGDKTAAKIRKYESSKDDCEKLIDNKVFEVENKRICARRDILHSILTGAAFFAFAWITMSISERQKPSLAVHLDEIGQMTLSTMNNTKTILTGVEEKSTVVKTCHQQIAANFFETIAKDLTQKTNATIINIDEIIQQAVDDMQQELNEFERGVSEGFDTFVDQTIEKLQRIETSVRATRDDDVIANLTVEAADTITIFLQDTEQMYLFYTRYVTSVLESKLQNTTDQMSMFLHSQRRFTAAKMTDRINLCYNICTQNTKTSRLFKSVLDALRDVEDTADVINSIEYANQPSCDESARLVSELKSSLAETEESGRRILQQLLHDDFYYLGSTVRKMVQQKHESFKRVLFKNLTTSVESLSNRWHKVMSNFQVIRSDQRLRMAKDFLNAVGSLTEALNATTRPNKNEKLKTLNTIKSTLMKKFDEVTSEVNSVFQSSQRFRSDDLHNYLTFTADRQLARLPVLSIQNFIPDDLCPLAMNFQSYIAFTLKTAMGRDVPDVMDELFALGSVSDENFSGPEIGNIEPDADNTGMVMIISFNNEETGISDEPAENGGKANFPGRDNIDKSVQIQSVEGSPEEDIPALMKDFLLGTLGIQNIERD